MTALANARVDVMTALVSFERVFEVLDLQPMITERPDARPLPDGPVGVRLRDVRFAYPGAERVSLASLEDVAVLDPATATRCCTASTSRSGRGRLLALVGPSGAGKSTIAALVPRLYDVDSGAVELAGVDVRDLTFAALRGAVGVVTQDGHLFHDTIRANLRYAAPEATRRRARRRPAPGPARRSARRRCPTGWTRWWASAATASPAASGSA